AAASPGISSDPARSGPSQQDRPGCRRHGSARHHGGGMGRLTWSQVIQELGRADLLSNAPAAGPEPRALGVDSRSVERGTLYIAVRGSTADGHRFVADAIGRGASAVIVETPQKSG